VSARSNQPSDAQVFALGLLGRPVRRSGRERSDYAQPRPDHFVVFDAVLRTTSASATEAGEILWGEGDLDLTREEGALAELAAALGQSLAVHEPPDWQRSARVELPLFTVHPDRDCSFDQRIARRAADGTLRRRGVRPEQHPPNRLAAWVFRQHQVWVDLNGAEHEIESMPRDYVRRVLGFCELRAERIKQILLLDAHLEGRELQLIEGRIAEGHRKMVEALGIWIVDPAELLEQLPVLRALRERLR
jgi:hypothetical protein